MPWWPPKHPSFGALVVRRCYSEISTPDFDVSECRGPLPQPSIAYGQYKLVVFRMKRQVVRFRQEMNLQFVELTRALPVVSDSFEQGFRNKLQLQTSMAFFASVHSVQEIAN
ncbi:hypothetical protein C7W88_17270 (plasmid) [Novosphingobium sp. THN1]|nr:hypothetical protein C7W88_17270 [Novosphingobium sp. THN1]